MKANSKQKNAITLGIEIILTIALCGGIAFSSFVGLSAESKNYMAEVIADYNTLTTDYIRDFKVLRMEAVEKIKAGLSFDEMQAWLQSRDATFTEAVGKDVFDGFAYTYKGGYVHSWNYGDYSNYDASTRPWYKVAKAAGGEVAVVAPYVTFLSNTDLVQKYDSLRMSIAQRYSDEVSFDYDLNVKEINALIANRETIYDGTHAFLYNSDGYILSSSDHNFYGHNINTTDAQISDELSKTLINRNSSFYGSSMNIIDGQFDIVFFSTDDQGMTVCLMVPFVEVFQRNFLFVLLLACVLVAIEVLFYRRNKIHLDALEKGKTALGDALHHAEEASHAKGDFMSRMSHEIRTPLNAIIGYLEIAHDDHDDHEKVEHCIEKSQLASRHLLSIINDVLDISAIESGRMKLANDPFDVKQMVNALTTLFYAQANDKGVAFTVHVDPLDTEWMIGDELRVRQILLNLLSNAIKFTAASGSICLSIRQVGPVSDSVHIEFAVKDTGIGMSEEYRSRMFTPFEQESASTARNYGGTGLGLSISNNLVHMMGGRITVESEQGVGTTFTVLLPFKVGESKEPVVPPQDFRHIRVLVVDDDQDTCAYTKKILERMGVTSDAVNSGKKALRRIVARKDTGHPYDLCILDWNMQEMDGMQTAKELRKVCGEELPIIIATAYDYTAIIDEARAIGVDKIVSKPLFQSTLFDLIVSTYGKYKPAEKIKKTHIDFTGTHLLLAEDNEMNMEIAMDILKKAGLVVTPVTDGQQALEAFTASDPGTYDAILMDVQMPVMDGYAATRAIRNSHHNQAQSIPIIAMTANAFTEDVTAALAAGMNDHVAKPISYDRLFDSLSRLINKNET